MGAPTVKPMQVKPASESGKLVSTRFIYVCVLNLAILPLLDLFIRTSNLHSSGRNLVEMWPLNYKWDSLYSESATTRKEVIHAGLTFKGNVNRGV